MAKVPDNGSQKSPDHIEQIRDIIFGPQKREYDQRFEKTGADLRRLKDDLSAGDRALGERIDQLTARFQEEIATLQKEMAAADRKLTADLEARAKGIAETIAALRQEMSDMRAKFQSELHAQKQELAREIDDHVTALRGDKVSRDMLAELLQAMALQLKGTTVMEELKKAVRKAPVE